MIGVNQSDLLMLKEADLNTVCEGIAEFGFSSVRFAVDWGLWTNLFGMMNYAPAKRVAKVLAAHGLSPMPILGVHKPWFGGVGSFETFVSKCIDIFGDCPFYEVWNEPNLPAFQIGGPATYLKYLRAATPKIRSVGAQVISAGLAAYPDSVGFLGQTYSATTWYAKMLSAGESNDFDMFGYHPYSFTDGLIPQWVDPHTNPFGVAQLSKLSASMNNNGDNRPIAITELGFDTNSVNYQNASYWLGKQLDSMRDMNIWLFTWRDSLSRDGGNYGLVSSRNKPKGLYYDAVSGMIK